MWSSRRRRVCASQMDHCYLRRGQTRWSQRGDAAAPDHLGNTTSEQITSRRRSRARTVVSLERKPRTIKHTEALRPAAQWIVSRAVRVRKEVVQPRWKSDRRERAGALRGGCGKDGRRGTQGGYLAIKSTRPFERPRHVFVRPWLGCCRLTLPRVGKQLEVRRPLVNRRSRASMALRDDCVEEHVHVFLAFVQQSGGSGGGECGLGRMVTGVAAAAAARRCGISGGEQDVVKFAGVRGVAIVPSPLVPLTTGLCPARGGDGRVPATCMLGIRAICFGVGIYGIERSFV